MSLRLTVSDLPDLARGAAFLGTGGGGNPYIGRLMVVPEWILIVGHPKPQARQLRAGAPKPIRARDLTYWERPGQHEP